MTRGYFNIIFILLLLSLFSCSEELRIDDSPSLRQDNLPVNIDFILGNLVKTREVAEDGKKMFEPDELIHVNATYYLSDSDIPKYQYCVLKYEGKGIWTPLYDDHVLTWPSTAIKADFSAYYLYDTSDMLNTQAMQPRLFENFKLDNDPLLGIAENIEYGGAVRLEMRHLFTRLIITQISDGISDEFLFTPVKTDDDYDNDNSNTSIATEYSEFKNAFILKLDNNGLVTHEFVRVESPSYQDSYSGDKLVYVKSNTEIYTDDDGETRARVGFFLEPKVYHHFNLLYPRSWTETATYLSFTNGDLKEQTGDDGLLANTVYEFSILKSQGVVVGEVPEENWDDSEPVIILDVEAFLRAAIAGNDYYEEDQSTHNQVQILERTVVGTRLLRNIDFKYYFYDVLKGDGFLPDLSKTFDGNYHYIQNLCCPLFNNNYGIISNLGIKNTEPHPDNILVSSKNYRSSKYLSSFLDFSQNGLICRVNNLRITNIRVINVHLTVEIQTTGNTDDESSQEAHSVALLVGTNFGTINKVVLGGNLSITARNKTENEIIPRVMIGGISGQNMGMISGLSELDNDIPSLEVKNQCHGTSGTYIVGGVVGNNTGNISEILISNLEVDGITSSGVVSIMGGLAGRIEESNVSVPLISGCLIKGSVKAGVTKSLMNIDSYSYTGGLAGSFNVQSRVIDSSASLAVYGDTSFDTAVKYATGGAFGRIFKTQGVTDGDISTLACFGADLRGNPFVGNFAGIAPVGYSWEDIYADKSIYVKQHSDYQNIASNE